MRPSLKTTTMYRDDYAHIRFWQEMNFLCFGDRYYSLIFIVSDLKVFCLTLAKVHTAKCFPRDSRIIGKTDKNGFPSVEYPNMNLTDLKSDKTKYIQLYRAKFQG